MHYKKWQFNDAVHIQRMKNTNVLLKLCTGLPHELEKPKKAG